MKFYTVVVKDGDDEIYSNKLYFDFNTIQEALKYAENILEITDYDVEILQCYDNEDGE